MASRSVEKAVALRPSIRALGLFLASVTLALFMLDITGVQANFRTIVGCGFTYCGGASFLRRIGATFHRCPSSVLIVTVFLLKWVSVPSISSFRGVSNLTRSPILNSRAAWFERASVSILRRAKMRWVSSRSSDSVMLSMSIVALAGDLWPGQWRLMNPSILLSNSLRREKLGQKRRICFGAQFYENGVSPVT